ncbi:hypothetical protein CONPUDRAFT_133694 [Coniophora puteana RWD-64-598 SS2]|uniref:Branched-chain-amino-acid aminotransferase n=1 Tax=Coniophora puteana (strain RWD-64-598) TaxID=741705 RepID=A0A5M3N4G6_CONPW|nr:uncharacterized protein CONPUDRAFT_133694 [Coniophora puteana RWD-64-598 SS2]EIW86147.1 hypothetical protein CONPUDRAFT_133694 [Coniophora puteana RWD-64-598 SS2]
MGIIQSMTRKRADAAETQRQGRKEKRNSSTAAFASTNKAASQSPSPQSSEVSSVLSEPQQLDPSKLKIRLTENPKTVDPPEKLKFGQNFTDHMLVVSYDPVSGWSDPEIKPYEPLILDPACSVLHYCTTIFEGMKAYIGPDGKPRLFRPQMNMRRMEGSVARLALPPIDGDAILELIKRFVNIEKRWIPNAPDYSLYLRPTVIGTRPMLGVHASDHCTFFLIASPCGPYFPNGLRPVSLLGVSDHVRAWPGGTGGQKLGLNYAPGFLPQKAAAARGYEQVLWLFGDERRVTEAGAMNLFVVVQREDGAGHDVLTAPLDGTILPGVTRNSCLALAADARFAEDAGLGRLYVKEEAYTMRDLVSWARAGRLSEVFCVGTAAVVCAVNRIGWPEGLKELGEEPADAPPKPAPGEGVTEDGMKCGFDGTDIFVETYEGGLGPVARALRTKILRIQEGRETHEWGVVCE